MKIFNLHFLLYLLLFLVLSISGCASPPWGKIVSEQVSNETGQLYGRFIEQSKECSSGFDGDVIARFHTQLKNITQAGFFQMLEPSYIKIVVSNPLGQPLLVISSNARIYQELNSINRTFKTVTHRSFSIRNEIPPSFMRGHWFAWLTGRPLSDDYQIRAIREDPEARGVWLEIGADTEAATALEHVLMDFSGNHLIERIIVAEDGSFQATISYADWQTISACEQPMNISVSGLSFGATANLMFSDLREAELKPRDFNLPYPQGYRRQYLP